MKYWFILLALVLTTAASAQVVKLKPQPIHDHFGNEVQLYGWTKFSYDDPFFHPNGYLYPTARHQKDVWVYTKPYRPTNWTGVLTLAALIGGCVDQYQRNHALVWKNWRDVGQFFGILGGGIGLGIALDRNSKVRLSNELGYTRYKYIIR